MHILDLTNFACPWTIIKTKQVMQALNYQEKLLIKVKDPSFTIDCKVYVKRTGHKLLAHWHNLDYLYFLLQKSSA